MTTREKKSGLWKFNCSLLKDKEYVDKVENEIKAVIEEYALTPYSRDNINTIPREDI